MGIPTQRLQTVTISILLAVATIWSPWSALPAAGASPAPARLRGQILLSVEERGEAWYVHPKTGVRYYLGTPNDMLSVMRRFGLGITNADLAKIPTANDSFEGDRALRARLSGTMLLQVESRGEAWYVYPSNTKRYSLGSSENAHAVVRRLALGISKKDLSTIAIGEITGTTNTTSSLHRRYTIKIDRGSFDIDLVTIPRDKYMMVTRTADRADCTHDCSARPLADYVTESGAVIGINGSYFCPPDYAACSASINSYNPPVFDSLTKTMINYTKAHYHNGPVLTFASDDHYRLYYRWNDFGDIKKFSARTNTTLLAAIGNRPTLMERGLIATDYEKIDEAFLTKASRGGIGYNASSVFLVVARKASVVDLANIFRAVGATDAMNLDGGGSTALYVEGRYLVGPGRRIPNAIVFTKR